MRLLSTQAARRNQIIDRLEASEGYTQSFKLHHYQYDFDSIVYNVKHQEVNFIGVVDFINVSGKPSLRLDPFVEVSTQKGR